MAGGLSCRHMAEGQGSQFVVGQEGEAGVQREEMMSWEVEPTALNLLVPVVQAQVYSALFSLVVHHVLLQDSANKSPLLFNLVVLQNHYTPEF